MIERRSGVDRRRPAVFPPIFSPHRRRRSKGRRKDDRAAYVDIYDAGSWGIALSILVLSLLDAFLTGIQMLAGRVREANPVMNAALNAGGLYTFFTVKAAMTAFPVAIILLHKEWKIARFAARACLCSYVLIALYHIYLMFI